MRPVRMVCRPDKQICSNGMARLQRQRTGIMPAAEDHMHNSLTTNTLQKAVFQPPKGNLSDGKRLPIGKQKVTFWKKGAM